MKGIVIALKSEADKILKGIVDIEWVVDIKSADGPIVNVLPTKNGENLAVIVSGVGKVNAALATQYLIDHCNNLDMIYNIGVCGATKAVEKRHTVFIDSAVEADFDTSEIDGEEFEVNNVNLLNPEHTHDTFNILYTADHFVVDKPYINGHQVEGYFDMEGYAVAKVGLENRVPVLLIKSITDIINDNEQLDQYQFNFSKACTRLNKKLKKELGIKSKR